MDKVVHTPLPPEEQERLKKLQEKLEGKDLAYLIEQIQKDFELSVNQIAIAAGMDESALHKILKGENREFKAEHVDRLMDDLQRQGKLKNVHEITIWKRALRIAAHLHFGLYKAIEPRLRQIEDPVERVKALKEYLSTQYPALAETYDETGGAFPAFLPLLEVIAHEWNRRWGWIRVPPGYQINVVKGNEYTIFSTDLFPGKVGSLGNDLIVEDTGFGTYTVKRRLASTSSMPARAQRGSYDDVLVLGNMEFMRVPAGTFLMGSENGYSNEKPQHTVDIPYDYWMARFPVTNMQYGVHVTAKGLKHPVSDWLLKPDHPVTHIDWYDAKEYCLWLLNTFLKTELPSGLVLRLPTEAEWEKAARGTDGCKYPWGNIFDKNKCNTKEGGKRGTTTVGLYSPQGDSPYGCADMSGNVWEWTHSLDEPYPYDVSDGREDENRVLYGDDFLNTRGLPVLRGGAFDVQSNLARCAYRLGLYPRLKEWGGGFRVVVSPRLPS